MQRTISNDEKMEEVPDKLKNRKTKPKRKYPGFRQNLYDYIQEFTDYTGIHGFKYMGEQDRTIFEKLWWIVLFSISLWICISLIIDTWKKWDTSPVLVSFAEGQIPVWQIPFPAVTICPETKTKQTIYNFTDAFGRYQYEGNLTEEELRHLSDTTLICDNHIYNDGNETIGLDTIDYLMSIAPQFDDVFFGCKWTLLNESCYNLFTPSMTEDGLCFTFNVLDRSDIFRKNVDLYKDYLEHGRSTEGWTLENGYPVGTPRDTFPRRAMSAGSSAGLFLLIKAFKQDLDYICKGPVQGFKVLLHHPAEIPRVSSNYFRVPLNQEVVVSIAPDMMTTSEGLTEYEPHRRQCYFPKEKYLRFFQYYTQQNCEVECLTNYTLVKCGCVAYHMPREKSTPICGAGNLECMLEAKNELLQNGVDAEISNQNSNDPNMKDFLNCDCLPSCTSLNYDSEFTQVPFHWEKIFEGYRSDINEFPGIQLSRITFFFKEQQFITSERNELYGLADFLANCGGILGLFTGFSFLSIVEIVYFLFLRFLCNVKMYGKHYWSGSSRLINDENYVH
ncbi:pickpocket protein 28-like [Anoplophora glabripennis]|uniref:pickpocket protein 28-like n=1 Tax=Anoplophora glabripennis TaxID=217634 RepID=UPI00087559DF|nr:pickpocket protein 28-like [Anoplophora glabripennis]